MNTEALCYIDGSAAFFTTQALADQWGDDWNDAPYEHNAGGPYAPGVRYYADGSQEKMERDWNADGSPKWTILEVEFTGNVRRPCDDALNSPYSVDQINGGAVPWLSVPFAGIYAGASLAEFREFIQRAGGTVKPLQG
jgi:hypothetical protein